MRQQAAFFGTPLVYDTQDEKEGQQVTHPDFPGMNYKIFQMLDGDGEPMYYPGTATEFSPGIPIYYYEEPVPTGASINHFIRVEEIGVGLYACYDMVYTGFESDYYGSMQTYNLTSFRYDNMDIFDVANWERWMWWEDIISEHGEWLDYRLIKKGEWVAVVDEYGNIVYEEDEYGNPVYEEDEYGNPVYEEDEYGNPVYEEDEYGNLILDEYGDPIPVRKRVGRRC